MGMTTTESGWAVAWDQPSFADARRHVEAIGPWYTLFPTLREAHQVARNAVMDKIDTHKPRVFWVVRAR